jgi:hypothetical protein
MKSFQKFLALLTIGIQLSATANAGRLQNEDFKSLSDLTAAGGTVSQLLNDTKVYVTANGINSQLSSAITSGKIGGGGGGSKNYLSTYSASLGAGAVNAGNGDFEAGTTTGFTLAHSVISTANGYPLPTSVATAGSAFSASSGGTAAAGTLTLTASTSSPLQKTTSGLLTSSAASTAGDMVVSSAFYIDAADQAKMLTISADTAVVSGTINQSGTSANTFSWWIYDVTNAQWIQPAGVYNITGSGQTKGVTFQTSTNSTQYQLALINTVATTGAYSFKLDELAVGPQVSNSAPAMSDWKQYSPTFTNLGSVTGVLFYSRRVGDSLEVYGYGLIGTGSAAQAQITLGYNGGNGNVTIDNTKITSGSTIGEATTSQSSTTYFGIVPLSTSGANYFNLGIQSSTTPGVTPVNGNATGLSAQYFSVHLTVPVVGWSSNTASSADTDTRVIAFRSSGTPTGSIANTISTLVYPSAAFDSSGSYSSSTGKFTVPVAGYYEVSAFLGAVSTTYASTNFATIIINQNSTAIASGSNQLSGSLSGTIYVNSSAIALCAAGDTLYTQGQTNNSSATVSIAQMNIKRLSGPAVVQATESVNARYTLVSNSSIPNATVEALNSTYATYTKIRDTHSAFSTTSGLYTAPVSGMYRYSEAVSMIPGTANTGVFELVCAQSGSASVTSTRYVPFGTINAVTVAVSDDFYLLQGDTIGCSVLQNNGGSLSFTGTGNANSFSIERVGN